jgi:hypothetical protein
MKKIYCISGLGADERIFHKLTIPGHILQYLQWLNPEKKETIESYSRRMGLQIEDEDPLLLGVSFGGMMAIEIAKYIPTQKIIIISSIKSRSELPEWMKISGKLNLNALVPPRSPKWISPFTNYYLGAKTEEEKKLAENFREIVSPVYFHWAIDKVINWQNQFQPASVFHIHGTHDKTFPIKNVQPNYVVQNGEHFMVLSRAAEISEAIKNAL